MKDVIQTLFRNKKPLLIVVATLLMTIWLLGSSFLNLIHNKLELKRLTEFSQSLDAQYDKLKAQKRLLEKQDPVYLNKIARIEYHMSAPGEKEFRFTEK